MKHTYKVTGMSCGGCVSTVEKTLKGVKGIANAVVSLPDNAEVEMDTQVTTDEMQEAINKVGNYTIREINSSENKSKEGKEASCCGGSNSTNKGDKSSCCE